MINIYCDESCHLEHDKQKVMAIGGIASPNYAKFNVYKDIKKLRKNIQSCLIKRSNGIKYLLVSKHIMKI